jgi:hypothetical protein
MEKTTSGRIAPVFLDMRPEDAADPDRCRSRPGAVKRGAGMAKVDIELAVPFVPEAVVSILALHEALESFTKIAPRQARVVELRNFGGLSVEGSRGGMAPAPSG